MLKFYGQDLYRHIQGSDLMAISTLFPALKTQKQATEGGRTLGRRTLGRGTLGRERKTRVDSRLGDLHRVDSWSGAREPVM